MGKQPFENIIQHLFQIAARAEFKTLNDQDLLKRYVEQQDGLAFGELLRRYKSMIWYVCWCVLHHHQDVEDAFQATVMTLVRRAKTVLGHATVEGWLHSTAFKVASAAKRDRKRRHAREDRSVQMHPESYECQDFRWEMGEVLNKELTRIPEKLRQPLIMCYLKGLTQKEAAEQLGISLKNLEWRLHEGRERLKKRLSSYGLQWGPMMLTEQTVAGSQIPEVPLGLVERTLDMVRIMTLSNGVLETAGISPQIATLVKGALGMTLKTKVLLGTLLLSLVVVSAGAAKYAGIFHILRGDQQQEEKHAPVNQGPAESKADKKPSRVDLYGDPLPAGALARLGTVRFRGKWNGGEIVFTPDSKAVGVFSIGEAPRLWDLKTGEQVRQFGDSLSGRYHAGSWLSLDGRRMAYIHHSAVDVWRNDGYHVHETATGKLIRAFALPDKQDAYCCSLSPDGKTLVGYFSGDLRLMDIGTGQPIWEQKIWEQKGKMEGICGPQSMLFSPDGQIVAVGYEFDDQKKAIGGIELRDARTGKSLRTLGHPWNMEKGTSEFSFSPDGQTLTVAYKAEGERKTPSVYLWDVATGKERWHLDKEKHIYRHPAFSHDGKIIALHELSLPTMNWEIGLYEVASGKKRSSCQQRAFLLDRGFAGCSLTFSPDGKILASMQGSLLRCWDVATGKVLALPSFGHESLVQSAAFASDGRTLISRGEDYAVYVWDSFTGQKQRNLSEETGPRQTKTFYVPSGSHAAAVTSADGKIVASARFEIPPLDEKRFTIPEDLKEALRASTRASIYIWDAASGRELRQIKVDCSKGVKLVRQLALSPDGKCLAAVLSTLAFDFVSLWEVATGKQIGQRIYGTKPTFSPDSMLLMMMRKDGAVTFWETGTGKQVSSVNAGVKISPWRWFTVTPDWQTLIGVTVEELNVKGQKTERYRWYLNSLHLNRQSKVSWGRPRYFDATENDGYNCSAVSPDGKLIAQSGNDGIIHLLETVTWRERARFKGHSGDITSLSFSPDGRRLASGSNDTTVLVWDVTGGWLDDHRQLRATRLSDQQVQQLWVDLGSADAARAGRAIWTLAAAPKQTLTFLFKHLSPIANDQASPQRIVQLIKELDSEKYSVRHKAEVELAKLGEAAEESICKSLEKKPSVEVRYRLKQLLTNIERERVKGPSGDVLRSVRAIEVLEQIGTPEARKLLAILTQGVAVRQTREAQAALHRLQQAGVQR